MPSRIKGDWWKQSLTAVSGCNWPAGERPEECRFCYAGPMCKRFVAIHGEGVPFSTVITHPDRLAWLKPTGAALTWLCSIAGDLFHPDVPDRFIRDTLDRIVTVDMMRREVGKEPHHVAILTKRYWRAVNIIRAWNMESARAVLTQSISAKSASEAFLLMPSAGTQASVDRACAAMAQLPEGVRWGLHCEPLLEAIDFDAIFPGGLGRGPGTWINGPSWIVAGGETNVRNRRAARPCHPDAVRGLRDQCEAAGVPFWFKSWGEWKPGDPYGRAPICAIDRAGRIATPSEGIAVCIGDYPKGSRSEDGWVLMGCVGKARAGRILDGRTHDEMPEGRE